MKERCPCCGITEAGMTDDLCQCPKCGKMHRNLGFGKPPSSRRPIHLKREGSHIVVAVKENGQWRDVIRERADAPFSHIWGG